MAVLNLPRYVQILSSRPFFRSHIDTAPTKTANATVPMALRCFHKNPSTIFLRSSELKCRVCSSNSRIASSAVCSLKGSRDVLNTLHSGIRFQVLNGNDSGGYSWKSCIARRIKPSRSRGYGNLESVKCNISGSSTGISSSSFFRESIIAAKR